MYNCKTINTCNGPSAIQSVNFIYTTNVMNNACVTDPKQSNSFCNSLLNVRRS